MSLPFSCPLDEHRIERIHNASMAVLAKTGIRFQSERALSVFREHGFRVDRDLVFFSEKQILDALARVPSEITILARNPAHNLILTREGTAFGPGRGAVTFVDPDGSSRRGTRTDFIEVAKLVQGMDILEHWQPLIHPADVPAVDSELWTTKTMLEYVDKPYNYSSARYVELAALGFGISLEEMARGWASGVSHGQGTVTTLSPLTLAEEVIDQLFTFVEYGIVFHIAAMPLAGTTGPCTFAGLLVQQNCENLAPMVLAQLTRPGASVFYGAIGSHADMIGMGPVFGSAESRLLELAGGQMASHYGLLCRGNAGLTDALGEDYQAGAEALLHILNVCQAKLNFLPGLGLLGSYMGASLAKIVLDAELISYAKRYLAPFDVDDEHLALDVMAEVGPGGEYVTHDHTLAHCRKEFAVSEIFNRRSYGDGIPPGGRDVIQRAHAKARAIIDDYRQPDLPPEIAKSIDTYYQAHRSR